MNEEEYSDIKLSSPNTYFSRARFEEKEEKLNPPPSEWNKMCSCDSPVNPDLEYVQCEQCEKWYHVSCIKNFFENDEKYICEKCNDIFVSDSSDS